MDDMSDMVFVMEVGDNDTFIYEYLNHAAREMVNYKKNVIGKALYEVNSSEVATTLHEKYKSVAESQTKATYKDSYITKTGETHYSETKLTPLLTSTNKCTHVMGVVKNITKEVSIAKKLEVSEENLHIISEYTDDIITLIDPNEKIIYISPTYEKMLGVDQNHCLGKDFKCNIYSFDQERVGTKIKIAIVDKKYFSIEFRQYTKYNQLIWCESRGGPVFNEYGELIHMVITTRNISDQKKYEEELKRLALRDPLTGLANRRLLKKHMTYALKILKEKDDGLAVIMLDIDNFKLINDEYGHATGDEVIKEYGKRINRSIDLKDTVARIGGDEFVVILPNTPEIEGAIQMAEKIKTAMNVPWKIEGKLLNITTSMGITLASSPEIEVGNLLKKADKALYEAKDKGKNNYDIIRN